MAAFTTGSCAFFSSWLGKKWQLRFVGEKALENKLACSQTLIVVRAVIVTYSNISYDDLGVARKQCLSNLHTPQSKPSCSYDQELGTTCGVNIK